MIGIIDMLNSCGSRKRYRIIGNVLLFLAFKIPFYLLISIAGRRIVTAFAGAPAILLTRSTIREAVQNPLVLYRAILFTSQVMKLDTMSLFADMSLEAEACGCTVHFDDFQVPSITAHPIKRIEDIAGLKVPDPFKDGRMPVFLETMRLMKRNHTMIKLGEVSGPFTLATSLAGTEMYLDTRRNPEKAKAVLEFCQRVITRYAQALTKSGADMILIAEPAGSQLSASAYEEFSLPYTRSIIQSLDRQCILHICGKAGHIIDKMCQSGAVALSIDDVDMAELIREVPRRVVVIGNVSPMKFARSSPEEIVSETEKLLETAKPRKEFLVAPGCDLPPQTPLENIRSFVKAVKGT
jgi:uroporphyrinogen decarboxylase